MGDPRDPNRIATFCAEFAELWKQSCPNFRFGQLVGVLMGEIYADCHRDPFFIEDEEMMEHLHAVFAQLKENWNEN